MLQFSMYFFENIEVKASPCVRMSIVVLCVMNVLGICLSWMLTRLCNFLFDMMFVI